MNRPKTQLNNLYSLSALLLLITRTTSKDKDTLGKVNDYLEKYKGKVQNLEDVEEMLTWILEDNFSRGTREWYESSIFEWDELTELKRLKMEMIKFYFKKLDDLFSEDSKKLNFVCDVHSSMGEYALQLMRLRMVIDPEINLLTNPFIVNKETGEKTLYLTAKAFWMGDDGKKVRRFTKSLGRMDHYPGGRKGKAAREESIFRLRPILWDEYKSIYP